MRKVLIVLVCLLLCFSFVGCSKNDSLKPQDSEAQQVTEKKELGDEELAEIVAKNLGVPDKDSIEYGVSKIYYWESAERYFKNITFTENGETVAGASVDPYTGELLRNIWLYDSSK